MPDGWPEQNGILKRRRCADRLRRWRDVGGSAQIIAADQGRAGYRTAKGDRGERSIGVRAERCVASACRNSMRHKGGHSPTVERPCVATIAHKRRFEKTPARRRHSPRGPYSAADRRVVSFIKLAARKVARLSDAVTNGSLRNAASLMWKSMVADFAKGLTGPSRQHNQRDALPRRGPAEQRRRIRMGCAANGNHRIAWRDQANDMLRGAVAREQQMDGPTSPE